MNLRLLEKRDIKEAAAIVGQNYSKEDQASAAREIKEMFGKSVFKPTYYVAEDKGRIIGFAGHIQSWIDYSIYQIFWVNVLSERQKQGIGQRLVTRLIREIKKEKTASLIQLTATIPNAKYYKTKFGFKTVDRFGSKDYHLMTLSVTKSK